MRILPPIPQQRDVGEICVDGSPQWLIGGDAGQLQFLGKRNKEGIIDRAVVLCGNLNCRIEQVRGRTELHGASQQITHVFLPAKPI